MLLNTLKLWFKNVRGRGTLFSFYIFFNSSLKDSNSKKDERFNKVHTSHPSNSHSTIIAPFASSHLRQSELFTHSSSSEVFRIHTTWVCRTKACHSCYNTYSLTVSTDSQLVQIENCFACLQERFSQMCRDSDENRGQHLFTFHWWWSRAPAQQHFFTNRMSSFRKDLCKTNLEISEV